LCNFIKNDDNLIDAKYFGKVKESLTSLVVDLVKALGGVGNEKQVKAEVEDMINFEIELDEVTVIL
jgi:hypothetical protein